MSPIQQMLLGVGAAADPGAYIDDIFSTFLYTGNAGSRTINPGVDLANEGGLTWIKGRNDSDWHSLMDTVRGAGKQLFTNSTSSTEDKTSTYNQTFTSTGYTINTSDGQINSNNINYVTWLFRKTVGFFEISTWTGTGSAQSIAHSLGSVPGLIFVKNRSSSSDWYIWHRSLTSNAYYLKCEHSSGESNSDDAWDSTTPTSTHFRVGTVDGTNKNGDDFVAYIFGHDVESFGRNGDASVIKCGVYTGNGNTDGTEINLGWRPQFVLHKKISDTSNWHMMDTARGIVQNGDDAFIGANLNESEANVELLNLTSTGFKNTTTRSSWNENNGKYVYMAIREEDSTVSSP